jgi:DNA-binding MarR family transcriptional regulator
MRRDRHSPRVGPAWVIPDEIVPDLEVVDAALMRLRRLWTAPRTHDGMRADLGDDVELSTVLVVDALAREAHDDSTPRGVAEVAERLDVAASTASRLVERAVAAGMVERRTSPVDARRAALHLTDAGWALHERARRFRAGYLARVLIDWSPREIAQLADQLDAFADAVVDAEYDITDNPPATQE